jgi:uncharacterized protein YjbI with pentapeptide repeats
MTRPNHTLQTHLLSGVRAALTALGFAFAAVGLSAPVLAQDSAAIARVQAGHSCKGCDLFQADLSYRDLVGKTYSNARLRQSDFTVAILDGSLFDGANMSIANLYGVRGTGASFVGTDLSGAVLVGTIFDGANFGKANLTDANISGANLSAAKGLTQGQLNRACGDSATALPKGLTVPACN